MRSAPKKYNTLYKKGHVEKDMYLPRLDPKGVIQCSGCGAFHYRRHWTLVPPGNFNTQVRAHPVFCPACLKIKDHYPGGELRLSGMDTAERQEIVRILRNEEEQARTKNPLERMMRLETVDGGWKIETTTEKLAQRLGRAVRKARGGTVNFKWSHNNKFVRVRWEKGTS
jgi:hypothetical protein